MFNSRFNSRKKRLVDLANEIADMDYSKFTEGEDYAALAKRYSSQGKKAMDDTIGQVAARTGGLASSYATAAGNQAYSGYMEKLEDAARAMYDDQRQEKMEQFNLQKALYDQGYKERRDDISDARWNAENTQKLISNESDKLKEELSYNTNAYPTYADYAKAFPGTLLTEADFNQIKNTATSGNEMAEADATIQQMLDNGQSWANIQQKYPDLVSKSSLGSLYWEAYANKPKEIKEVEPADMEKKDIDQWVADKKYPSAAINAKHKKIYGYDIPYYFGEEGEQIHKGLTAIFKTSKGKDGTVYSLPDETKVQMLEDLLKFNGGGESTYEMIINMAEALGYDLDPLMEILNKSNKE